MLGHGDLTKTGSIKFFGIMRPTRPNLKIKHEINYSIEPWEDSRFAGKLKLCLVQICYIITLKTNTM